MVTTRPVHPAIYQVMADRSDERLREIQQRQEARVREVRKNKTFHTLVGIVAHFIYRTTYQSPASGPIP